MSTEKDLSEQDWKDIGNRIKIRRQSMGIKQQKLADDIGISYTHMSSIENGRQHPSIYVLIKLSEKLNVTPDYFLLGNIRKNSLSQKLMDNLLLCNEAELLMVESIIEVFRSKRSKTKTG